MVRKRQLLIYGPLTNKSCAHSVQLEKIVRGGGGNVAIKQHMLGLHFQEFLASIGKSKMDVLVPISGKNSDGKASI